MIPKIVDLYFESAKNLLSYDTWIYPLERFKRCIALGRTAKQTGKESEYIAYFISEAKDNEIQKDGFFALSLAEHLLKIGYIKNVYDEIMDICKERAGYLIDKKDIYKANRYYELLAKISHNVSKFDDEKEYLNKHAECTILLGEEAKEKQSSYLGASHHYSSAVEIYKRAGNYEKSDEMSIILSDYQLKSMSELEAHPFSMDISEMVGAFQESFKGLDFIKSAMEFSKQFCSPTQVSIDKHLEMQKNYVFKSVFGAPTFLNSSGQFIAKGVSGFDETNQQYIKQTSFEYLKWNWELSSATIITVFVQHIMNTHYGIREIEELVYYNPFVEQEREQFFVDGIIKGLRCEFSTALHILIPQIENMLRYILKKNGKVITKTVDGVQEEMDINELLTRNSFKSILEHEL